MNNYTIQKANIEGHIMIEGTISDHQKTRIKDFITQGIRIKQEVKDLNDAVKDLAKTIGEEISVKPAVLTKALSIAFKGTEKAEEEREQFTDVEEILAVAGII